MATQDKERRQAKQLNKTIQSKKGRENISKKTQTNKQANKHTHTHTHTQNRAQHSKLNDDPQNRIINDISGKEI